MIALPATAGVIILGLLAMQAMHYRFLMHQKDVKDRVSIYEGSAEFQKEFEEYKKRVDALVLKAGFKF